VPASRPADQPEPGLRPACPIYPPEKHPLRQGQPAQSPLHGFTQNQIWTEIVALACELLAWTRMLTLTGSARRWEPKRLRLRLFSAAGRLARGGRHLGPGVPPGFLPHITPEGGACVRIELRSEGPIWHRSTSGYMWPNHPLLSLSSHQRPGRLEGACL
jgi:hypothetical protein